jgi:CHAT domain
VTLLVVLRVGVREPGVGYPLELFEQRDGDWQSVPTATASVPDDLLVGLLDDQGVTDRDEVVDALHQLLEDKDAAGSAERVGDHLVRLLAQGDVQRRWDELAHDDVRFGLEVADEELGGLPWELLYSNGRYLFADQKRPWSRVDRIDRIEPAAARPEWSAGGPLRILVVVGSAPEDQELSAEEEVRGIVRAIADSEAPIEWHVERRPRHQRLRVLLESMQPHVLHFIGHAHTSGALQVAAQDAPWEYTTQLIGADLDVACPALVVLNACATAGSGVTTVAGMYRSRGVCATIAMQGDVRGADAREFSTAFYRAMLNDGLDLDAAVVIGRLSTDSAGLRLRDFAFASLTLNQHPEAVLPPPRPTLTATARDYIDDNFKPGPFVDRCEERSLLARAIANTSANGSTLVTVTGSEWIGKTWLVRSCLHVLALRGRNVAYVDLAEPAGEGLRKPLEVLRDIRERLGSCPRHGAANSVRLADVDLGDDAFDRARGYAPVVEAFRIALEAAAKESSGVVVAIDPLAKASEEFRDSIGKYLLRPAADGELPDVRFVVVRDSDEKSAKRYPFRTRVEPTIEMTAIPAADCEPLAMSLLYHLNWQDAATLARSTVTQYPHDWDMEPLGRLQLFAGGGPRRRQ